MKIRIKAIPNAGKNEVIGWFGDQLKIKIAAAPAKGKANKALIEYLSNALSISKSEIKILHGHTSSNKILKIEGMENEGLESKLGVPRLQESLFPSPSVRGKLSSCGGGMSERSEDREEKGVLL